MFVKNSFLKKCINFFGVMLLLYSSLSMAAISVNQKVTLRVGQIRAFTCPDFTCSSNSWIQFGATGAVIGSNNNPSDPWIQIQWDGIGTYWFANSDYYFQVLPDSRPDLSNVNLYQNSNGERLYFSGAAIDDWNIRTIEMRVDGRSIFTESVSGKQIDFSRYYFDPKEPTYAKGNGTYFVSMFVSDIIGASVRTFQVNVSTAQPQDNPPVISSSPFYTLQQGQRIYFSGGAQDDVGLAYIAMNVTAPNGSSYNVFARNFAQPAPTFDSLTNYYFDSSSYYAPTTGRYSVHFSVVDSRGQQGYYTTYVDVTASADKAAKQIELQNKINELNRLRENALVNQQIQTNTFPVKQQAVQSATYYYQNALAEKGKIAQQTNINLDVKPNDPRLDGSKCSYIQSNDTSVCNVTNWDSRVKSQQITVEYAQIDTTPYPALVYGTTEIEEQLLSFGGATSDGKSVSKANYKTPIYIANNNAQLNLLIDLFNKNNTAWTTKSTDGFNEELARIAAAQQVTDATFFNIDKYQEEMLDIIDMTNGEFDVAEDKADQITAVATDAVVSAIPYVGNGKSLLEVLAGKNLITQEELSGFDRTLNVAFVIVPQAKLLRISSKVSKFGIDGTKYVKALVVGNRLRGLKAAKYLRNNPSLIAAGLTGCEDEGIKNYGVSVKRFPDVVCNAGAILIESKVGSMKNTKRLREQLAEDIKIAHDYPKRTIYWVSSISSYTKNKGNTMNNGFAQVYQDLIDKAIRDGQIKPEQIQLKILDIAIDI